MRKIALTKGYVALVDDIDFDRINQHKWQAVVEDRVKNVPVTAYAQRTEWYGTDAGGKRLRRTVRMARVILDAQPGEQVDHIERPAHGAEVVDNRRSNLRLATHAQNMHNQRIRKGGSRVYKGVCWHRKERCWRAHITVNGRQTHVGRYHDEVEAAKAYDRAALKHFGAFAQLNFPTKQQEHAS